jgi:predicted Ser/Thr protein kinase
MNIITPYKIQRLTHVENGSYVSVKVVDDTTVLCKGKGIVTFNTTDDDDDDPTTLVLENFLYVPGLIRRLFSVGQFTSK